MKSTLLKSAVAILFATIALTTSANDTWDERLQHWLNGLRPEDRARWDSISQEDKDKMKVYGEARQLMQPYVVIFNDLAVLNLGFQQAKQMGISEHDYMTMIITLNASNLTKYNLSDTTSALYRRIKTARRDTSRVHIDSINFFRNSVRVHRDSVKVYQNRMRVHRDFTRVHRDSMRVHRDSMKVYRDFARVHRDSMRVRQNHMRIRQDSMRVRQNHMKVHQDSMRIYQNHLRVYQDSIKVYQNRIRVYQDSIRVFQNSMKETRRKK